MNGLTQRIRGNRNVRSLEPMSKTPGRGESAAIAESGRFLRCALVLGPIVLSLAVGCGDLAGDSVYMFPNRARQGDLVYLVVGGNLMPANLAAAFEEGADRAGQYWGFLDGTPRPIFSLSRGDIEIGFYEGGYPDPTTTVSPIAVFPLVADPTSYYSVFWDLPDASVQIAAFVVPIDLEPGPYVVRPTDNPHAHARLEVVAAGGDPQELNTPHSPPIQQLEPHATLRLLLQRGGDVPGSSPIDPDWEVGAISLTLQSEVHFAYVGPVAPFTVVKVVPRADAAGALALSEGTVLDDDVTASTKIHIIAPDGIHFTAPIDEDVETLGRGPFLDLVVDPYNYLDVRTILVWVEELTLWDVDGNVLRSGEASLPDKEADFVRVLAVQNPLPPS